MTPAQKAKTECANYGPDGKSQCINPSSWLDYSMSLPKWMTAEQWDHHIAEARLAGEKTIKVDTRSGELLDTSRPHANQHRLDMYFCPECGKRMGCIDETCLRCDPPANIEYLKAQAAKEPTAKQWMAKNPRAPRCSRCKAKVSNCSKQAVAALCWKCTAKLAELAKYRKRALGATRRCPECGGDMPVRRRYCDVCRERRKRSLATLASRRYRQGQKPGV